MSSLERLLIIPDSHFPYQDKKAWGLMLRAARKFKPHTIIQLGDMADFYSVSAHSKDPLRAIQFDDEVASVNEGFDDLDELGAKRKEFVSGNHEFRLQRFLHEQAPALTKSMSVQKLFRLKERGWGFTPYRDHLKVGKLHITHECGNAGPDAHKKAGQRFAGNVVIGHTHRMATHYFGNAKGERHVAAHFGWLGDSAQVDYAHRIQMTDWQLGFGLGWMEKSGIVHLQAVPIVKGRCLVNGEIVK